MSIATIPPANNPNPLILPDTLDNDDNADDEPSNNDKSSNDNSLQGGTRGCKGRLRQTSQRTTQLRVKIKECADKSAGTKERQAGTRTTAS